MTTFSHYCPDLSPNNKAPNMTASGCSARVKRKEGKCARCPSGIGYVAPPAKIKPPVKYGKKQVQKPSQKIIPEPIKKCGCGADREQGKRHPLKRCRECKEGRRHNIESRARIKRLLAEVERNLKKIDELKHALVREY